MKMGWKCESVDEYEDPVFHVAERDYKTEYKISEMATKMLIYPKIVSIIRLYTVPLKHWKGRMFYDYV